MTIKKYIIRCGIVISVIISFCWSGLLYYNAAIIQRLPFFYYYSNIDNAYSEEIGSPRKDVEYDYSVTGYAVHRSGSVIEIKDDTKEKNGTYAMLRLSFTRMKELVKELKPMLENDQKEYKNNKDMQYKVRLIRIYNKEYRVVSEESDKIIEEIIACIRAT